MKESRFVGIYAVEDSKITAVNMSKNGKLNGRYVTFPDNAELDEQIWGKVVYNVLTTSAIVIMPVKDIEIAKQLTPIFGLEPARDDFITWDEVVQWIKD